MNIRRWFVLGFALFIWAGCLVGEERWVRGGVAVKAISGVAKFNEVGALPYDLDAKEEWVYASGVFRIVAKEKAVVALVTSHQVSVLNEGPGFFAVERFDHIENSEGAGSSRTIFNLRQGTVIVDDRGLDSASKLILETPVGRVASSGALWTMTVRYEERSRIFTFSVACAEGTVRFTDVNRESYVLRLGQRIAGAGASTSPAVEVGENGEREQDIFGRFEEAFSDKQWATVDRERLSNEVKLVTNNVAVSKAASDLEIESDGKRPILIEFALRPDRVTPFQGVSRVPSFYVVAEGEEADVE